MNQGIQHNGIKAGLSVVSLLIVFLLGFFGLLAIFGTLGVIILHAVGRIVTGKNGKKEA